MNLRILDCDGSVVSQPFAAGLLGSGAVVDARALAPKLRIVASRNALQQLREKLLALPHARNEVFFIGSGDFHHLTVPLLERLMSEVVVVHFDNHPDWVRFPGTLNCGSWVNHALALPQVKKVVTIGLSSSDLAWPELKFANLQAIRDSRLEVHAWRAAPTWLLGRAVTAPGVSTTGRHLTWGSLCDGGWPAFLGDLCERLSGERLWITFDKDVLAPADAVTNWDQGGMRLNQILDAIDRLALHSEISGVDICGDYSPPEFQDMFRRLLSWADRPHVSPEPNVATRINDATNRRILSRLGALFKSTTPNDGSACVINLQEPLS